MPPPSLPRVPLTNIGTSVPPRRAFTEAPQRFRGPSGPAPIGRPEALPIAGREGEEQQQFITPEPLWISRWQPSATKPLSKAPWVIGYRWYLDTPVYADRGRLGFYEIQCRFKGGWKHWYRVPREVWLEFRGLQSSVGRWIHQKILGPGWTNKNRQALYPNGPLP